MAALATSLDGPPPSWERRQQRQLEGEPKTQMALRELAKPFFFQARSLSSNSFRTLFPSRESKAQILWFLKMLKLPFCSFLSHCYKITFGLKKMVKFFSAQNEIYFDFFPPINPTFENFSLILLLLITKNQENHVNYDYDSNRFSVQTWRKKKRQKKEKNQKIWEIDDETMFFWAKWYLLEESAMSMTDMAGGAIWMGQDSNYGFSRQRKSQWCVTSCTWNWIVDAA